MHFNISDVFYSKCSHQHISAGIQAIFKVMLLFHEYRRTNVVSCVTITLRTNVVSCVTITLELLKL